MADRVDLIKMIQKANFAHLSEPIILQSGDTVMGLFDPVGDTAGPVWSEIGLDVRLSEQASPSVLLRSEDASLVSVDDVLTIRGDRYSVTRLRALPDLPGATRVELMPELPEAA